MGPASGGAVNAAVRLLLPDQSVTESTGCNNLEGLIVEIQKSINLDAFKSRAQWQPVDQAAYRNEVARQNMIPTMGILREQSVPLNRLALSGKFAIVRGLYDVKTGHVAFFQTPNCGNCRLAIPLVILGQNFDSTRRI